MSWERRIKTQTTFGADWSDDLDYELEHSDVMGTQCFRSISDVDVVNGEQLSIVSNYDENVFVDNTSGGSDQRNAATGANHFMTCLSPLLTNMKLLGIYFKQTGSKGYVKTSTSYHLSSKHLESSENADLEVKLSNRNGGRTTSRMALMLLWFNIVRCATAFTACDKFGSVLAYKVTLVAIDCFCATMHTSYYVACRDGKLDSVLRCVRLTDQQQKFFHRLAVGVVTFAWLWIIKDAFLLVYVDYFSAQQPSYLLAPLQVYIPVDGCFFPLLIALAIMRVLITLPYCWFTFAMNQFITMGLCIEFKKLNQRFKKAVDSDGRFSGSIRQFRHQHQALRHAVQDADHFIRIGNVGGFACHMIAIIFLLYSSIFHQFTDASFYYTLVMGLVINDVFFILATIDGIAVNHVAHKLNDIIYDLDLSNMSQNDVNELNMLQKRVSGNPIGYSVLGIFVINKSTVLSIFSNLITYFLLVVQLSTPTKDTDSFINDENTTSTE